MATTAAPAAAGSGERIEGPQARWLDLSVLLCYLALAVWVLQPLWRDPGHLNPATNGSDPGFFEWALIHATRIFTHGEHPFFTPALNAPLGVNLMANTGLLGLTIPLVPVTLIFGPSASFTLLLTLGLVATAGAWYFVLSRHLVTGLAAAIGGGFAGFAPGMVNHTNAHPNIVAQFLIPFIVWRALTMRTVRDGALLGLLVTWQALINEELLFLAALAGGVFVAGYAVFRPAEVRARIRPFLTAGAVAVGTAAVLLAYPLWFQFFGPQSYRGLPDFVLTYGADLASYPAFPRLSLAHGAGTLAPQPEENTFLGWPLLVALVVIVAWRWRRIAVRALALVAIVFAVLSLGTSATYQGRTVLAQAPWGWLNTLPLFDSVVPGRLGLVLIPVIAILLAFAVEAGLAARPLGYLALAGVAAALLPIVPIPLPVQPRPPVPAFFTGGDWRRYVSGNQSVVSADTTVWYGGITAMGWDNATRHGYRMVGGYFLGPDPTGKGGYGTQALPTASLLGNVVNGGGVPAINATQRTQLVVDAHYWHAAIFVVTADAPHANDLRTTLDQLIGPGQPVNDVWLWDVRSL
jgi:hypothetical protein